MTALIVILAIVVYIAIGFVCDILCVKCNIINPYDETEGFLFAMIFVWPILGVLALIFGIFVKFTEYLQRLYDKEH